MLEEDAFDFRPRDIDAATNNNIVVPTLIMEEAVGVADVNVAGNVPALPDIVLLAKRQSQVTAACWAFNGKKAFLAIRHRHHSFLIDHDGLISRHHFAGGAGASAARSR